MTSVLAASTFHLFDASHLTVMALTVAVPVGLSILTQKVGSERLTRAIGLTIAAVIVLNDFVFYVHTIWAFGVAHFLEDSLPLHVCGLAVFLTAWVLATKNQFIFELTFFWGMAGTLQAVITPEIEAGFPSLHFAEFFIRHCGIVSGVLYAVLALKMRPRAKGILITLVASNCVAAVVGLIDWGLVACGLDANYMYLCRPPDAATPFFFLPWPWYILALEPLALAMFGILYLPFLLLDWVHRVRRPRAGDDGPGQSAGTEVEPDRDA